MVNESKSVLVPDGRLSYGKQESGNMLIQGDNLNALELLKEQYSGSVKAIYIDPPYNTNKRFRFFNDNFRKGAWVKMMYPRLKLMRELISNDGSIWVSIDDGESHYLKVLMDEVFGRQNFLANCIWQRTYTLNSCSNYFSRDHDHLLVFAKDKRQWKSNLLPRSTEMNQKYKNPDNHPKGKWNADSLSCRQGVEARSSDYFSHKFENGAVFKPRAGCFSRYSHDRLRKLERNKEIWFGKNGSAIPTKKTFFSELKKTGQIARTLWLKDEVGTTHEAKREITSLGLPNSFDTPKPERLIKKIFQLSSNPGDLILDAFLGSGTTAAVAMKMQRKFIGIEVGDQARTHCALRLKKVTDGEQGGISKLVGWEGGGGFKFFNIQEQQGFSHDSN